MSIELKNIKKSYRYPNGLTFDLLLNMNISIQQGITTSFIGPKGCGKSFILKMIAGIKKPTGGIIIDNDGILKSPLYYSLRRPIPNNPEKNIEENITEILSPESNLSTDELLSIFGLQKFRKMSPFLLTGYTRIKFDLCLIFAQNPSVIILDESFLELDSYSRTILDRECASIFGQFGKTVIVSTNDVAEAITLSDTLIVLDGRSNATYRKISVDIDKENIDSAKYIKLQEIIYEELSFNKPLYTYAKKINCWEYKKCGREKGGNRTQELGVCPASTETRLDGVHGGSNAGRACWVTSDAWCSGDGLKRCEKCDFYALVKRESPDFPQVNALLMYMTQREDNEKKKYRILLENVLDPAIITQALTDLDVLKKGGEKMITAFFSDIESFSAISEKLSNTKLFDFINEYLSAMSEIITKNKGTIDKYVGDAIVAFFGAPVEYEKTGLQAAQVAIEMLVQLEKMKKKWKKSKLYCSEVWNMRIRIGLNTGIAKLGFMGSDNHSAYTMMGETVNIAQWMEQSCKQFGVPLLMTKSTYDEVKGHFDMYFLGDVFSKNETKKIPVYSTQTRFE